VQYRTYRTVFLDVFFNLPTHLLSITVSFSCIYISQGSVATQLTCGGIFNNHFIANCPRNASLKNVENRLTFSEDMDNHKVGRFWNTV